MSEKLPKHVAIIMDGNGRWAENKGLQRFEGHRAGVATVKTIVECCLTSGIPVLSLFAFSSENWLRPSQEVEFLMQLFLESLEEEIASLHKQGIALRFIGLKEDLSKTLQEQMHKAEQTTGANNTLTLNIVINYGGRWDIVQASKKIAQKVLMKELTIEAIDEEQFAHHLATQSLPEPDLFIRTSGEQRISNFFLWQLAYTELYFTSVHWPDFNKDEFENALASFQRRERRYGKTSEQLDESNYV